MEKSPVHAPILRFGPFELSRDAGELRKSGIHLKLQDQPFQVLCTLLDHPGELVTREQLRQQLWPEGTFVDFEHGLNTAIKKLRDVLSDDADTPRYIETVPRKGYKFIAPLNEKEADKSTQTSLSRRPHYALLTVAIVVLLSAVLSWILLVRPKPLTIVATKQLTFSGDVLPFKIQTDGRRLFYSRWLSQDLIYTIPVNGGEETSITAPIRQPALLHISPDGSKLLAVENLPAEEGRIWLLSANGGPGKPLGDIVARFAAWSSDGKFIAFSKGNAIYLTADEGASYRKLFDAPGLINNLRWAPEERRLSFDVTDPNTRVSSLWEGQVGAVAHSLPVKREPKESTCCGDWTRDGRYFFFSKTSNERQDYWYLSEGRFRRRFASPHLLTTGGFEIAHVTASPLENRLFVLGLQNVTTLHKLDIRSHQVKAFLPEFYGQMPNFSRDGKWMVVCQRHNNQRVLWRARTDGSEWLQLTQPNLFVLYGRYSPDGNRIALMAKWPDHPWKIYLVSNQGGALQELNVPVENQADPNWTPDGESLIFGEPPTYEADLNATRVIYLYNFRTNSLTKLPGTEGWFSPRLSSDGRQLLALSVDQRQFALYDIAAQKWKVLIDATQERSLEFPFWSADGTSAFISVFNRQELVRVRLSDGRREDVVSYRDATGSPRCWANTVGPDGSPIITCWRPNMNIYSLEYK